MKIYEVMISRPVVEKFSDLSLYINSFNIYPSGENYISEKTSM